VGYRYRMNDDIYDELSGSGYTLTGWARLIDRLTLRAGMNFDDESVDAGRTLTGAREESRHWMSLRYREQNWFARIKIENRERETELIGTSFDLLRFAGDVWFNCPELGELSASYAYSNGDYDNTDGAYEYREHVVSGEFTAREYMRTTLGFGGHYHRGLEDVDVEAFEVRLTGRYRVDKRIRCEVIYSAHNFDNLADTSIPYHEFYTANVVHFNVMYEL